MNMFHSVIFLVTLTVLAGAALASQAGVNSVLAKYSSGPLWAACISFFVGAFAILAFLLLSRQPMPMLDTLVKTPPVYFLGGVLGVFYVAVVAHSAPLLGSAQMISMIIAGQLVAALLLDHFGWLGFSRQAIDVSRSIGVVCVLLGVWLLKQ